MSRRKTERSCIRNYTGIDTFGYRLIDPVLVAGSYNKVIYHFRSRAFVNITDTIIKGWLVRLLVMIDQYFGAGNSFQFISKVPGAVKNIKIKTEKPLSFI